MFDFHHDSKKYFDINAENTKEYIFPFISKVTPVQAGMRVLEIGCGEGGVLKHFLDLGLHAVGVEFDEIRLTRGRMWLAKEINEGRLLFINKNIYDADLDKDLGGAFDLIILKDVIEHIVDQQKLLHFMRSMLKDDGVIFFGFPPWQMPLGGHQQILKNKWLSKIPYYHLLPMTIYKWILARAGENVAEMVEIKETGLSIETFERLTNAADYRIINKQHFLINPIYQYKFGWKPRTQFLWMQSLPVIRNFFTSCVYYLIKKN